MEESKPSLGLFFISLSLLFFAGVLTFLSYQRYRSIDRVIPDGSEIAGISITGLEPDEAIERVKEVYGNPVILSYRGSLIQMDLPDSIDFEGMQKELESRFEEVYAQNNFISYLTGKYEQDPVIMDLQFNDLTDHIRSCLENEIAPRYDIPAISVQPTGTGFRAGHPGRKLDIDAAVPLIDEARRSGSSETVELPVTDLEEPAADIRNLEVYLRSVIDTWQDKDQVTEVYLSDPASDQNFDLARRNQTDLIPE